MSGGLPPGPSAGDSWFQEFVASAGHTDQFATRADRTALLGAGLFGEAGSVVAELKKEQREREAYPGYRHRVAEELGDFLWYFARLVGTIAPTLAAELQATGVPSPQTAKSRDNVALSLAFGVSVGQLVSALGSGDDAATQETLNAMRQVWRNLVALSSGCGAPLREAADENIRKRLSRWPGVRNPVPLFDNDFPETNQLPRQLDLVFLEEDGKAIIRHGDGTTFGDPLTDNIEDPDGYRYHDVFHLAHAAYLGWSPVLRALLRRKRKSDPTLEEAQDSARASLIEESVATIVFARARNLRLFEGLDSVDLDLLKTIKEFVTGYEVDCIPMWQWEEAILHGYSVFRALLSNNGGVVRLDLTKRQLLYVSASSSPRLRGR